MTHKFGNELIKEHDKEIYNKAINDLVEKIELNYTKNITPERYAAKLRN